MCKDGKLASVILWSKRSVVWREPIDQRGWTLQESLISIRNLEYGENQIHWQCRSSRQTDGWTPGKIENFGVYVDWDMVAGHSPQPELFENFISTWTRIVENYSMRNLGRPDDKLIALSSIARKFGQLSGKEYVAGLWKHALPRFLLWQPFGTGKYIPKYVAPSWSWASIDGGIRFNTFLGVQMNVINISVVTLVLNDIYSPVMAGHLEIRAKVRHVMIYPRAAQFNISKCQRLCFSYSNLPYAKIGCGYCDVSADDLDQDFWNEKVLLLQVALEGGLILRQLKDGTFCRIGMFDHQTLNFDDRQHNLNELWQYPDWVERSVVIV